MGRNTFAVTEANLNNCQNPLDPLRTRPGIYLKQDHIATALIDMDPMDVALATNGHHESLLTRNSFQENGYGSPADKQKSVSKNRDFQYERVHREEPKNFASPVTLDSLPKENMTGTETDIRHCETWKIKDPCPIRAKDCNKAGSLHSEVTKIVPLKPQRSKKSLSKENKGVVHPQTQSQPERGVFSATGNVQMIKSKDGFCEAGRRVDDYTVLQSATDVGKENAAATKYHSESAMLYQQQTQLHQKINNESLRQQEPRDCRDLTGQNQLTRGREDHFQNNLEIKENLMSSSKFPTAPPRTLPLKTQWSRDRQGNMDNSQIHYRTPTQETTKRKQAVKHLPQPVCQSSESKTLHELQAMSCKSCFCHEKTHTHTSELMWLCMRKQKFTFLRIASLTDSIHAHGPRSFLLSLVPVRKA